MPTTTIPLDGEKSTTRIAFLHLELHIDSDMVAYCKQLHQGRFQNLRILELSFEVLLEALIIFSIRVQAVYYSLDGFAELPPGPRDKNEPKVWRTIYPPNQGTKEWYDLIDELFRNIGLVGVQHD